jgi:hypothetical protein
VDNEYHEKDRLRRNKPKRQLLLLLLIVYRQSPVSLRCFHRLREQQHKLGRNTITVQRVYIAGSLRSILSIGLSLDKLLEDQITVDKL